MSLLKSFKIIISALLIAVTLTGCMKTVHLKDLIVVEGMGIDSKDGNIQITVQTLNTSSVTNGESPKGNITINTTDSGKTIVDAVSVLAKKFSKHLFFGQNKAIVFGRDVAEKDFEKNLDYFLRSADSRPDVAVCIADKSSKDILDSKENDAQIPIENIVRLMRTSQSSALGAYVTNGELLNMYSDKTTDIYMPVIKINDDTSTVQIKGIGLFNNNKLTYVTDDEETVGIILILDKVKGVTLEYDDKELGGVGVELSHIKTKKSAKIVDGNVVFCINISANLMVNEIQNGIITAIDSEGVDRITHGAEREIERLCSKGFGACVTNNSDAIRVGEYLAKDCPSSYDLLSDDWDVYFPNIKSSISVDLRLKKISDNTQLD